MDEFIEAEKRNYSVVELSDNLGIGRSSHYDRKHREPSQRARDNERLTTEIVAIHAASKQRYGSPRIHAELVESGHQVGDNRVARLMRKEGIAARPRRRFRVTTESKHDDPIAPNLLARDFTAERLNEVLGGRHYVHLDG